MGPLYDTEIKGLFYFQSPFITDFSQCKEVDGLTVDVFWNLYKNPNFFSRTTVYAPLGRVSAGIKEINIVKNTPAATYGISSNWWTNSAKTVIAGSYNASEHSFLPTAAGAASDSLFLEITHHASNCKNIITLPANKETSCQNQITNFNFVGTVSEDWFEPGNWPVYNQLPNACSKVSIPAGKKVHIDPVKKVRIHSIETIHSSVFEGMNGAVVELERGK